MIKWDWQHANDLEIRMAPQVQAHPTKAGTVKPVRDPNNVRQGACASKSYLWSKRCLQSGAPPATRSGLDGDKTTGLGLTQHSIATQALQSYMQRHAAQNGYDPAIWNRQVAAGHGLTVVGVGNGGAGVHSVWLEMAIGASDVVQPSLKGPYVITVWGPTYFHSMALYSDFQCSFFDPEKGQFSYPRNDFRARALEFLTADYPGLAGWDLWKPKLG